MADDCYEHIRFERRGDVGWLRLARPERLNAQTPRMWAELRAVGESIADTGLRCLIVTGEGRAFSSGLDRSEQGQGGTLDKGAGLAADDPDRVVSNIFQVQRTVRWIHEAPYVTIAAVRGYALGAGMQLALACDLRIVAEDAVFAMPEVNLGIVPDMCGTAWLPRLVGNAVAKQLIFLGDRIGAEEALRLGLVNRVVPGNELEPTVETLADRIAAQAPIAIRHAKAAIDAPTPEDSYRRAAEGTVACLGSSDFSETTRAAREQRRPVYRGL